MKSGPDKGAVFSLNKSKFLGSQDDCEVRLHDPSVELVHARLKLRSDGCMIVSLAERVGLKVNGAQVRAAVLEVGDLVAVGDTILEVVDLATVPATAVRRDEELSTEDVVHRPATVRMDHGMLHSREQAPVAAAPVPPPPMGRYVIYSALGILLALVTVITVDELSDRRRQREIIKNTYDEALTYAMAHPREYDKIVEKYKIVLALSIGEDRNLENYVRQEITRLEAEKARSEAQLTAALYVLDRKSADAVAMHDYDTAVKTYEMCEPSLRSKVLAARTETMAELRREALLYAQKMSEERAKAETEKKAAREKQVKQDLNLALKEIVDLMIKGDTAGAAPKLAALVADSKYEYFRPALDTAQTTLDLLTSTDKIRRMNPEGKEVATSDGGEEYVSPIVAAVIAVRRGDMNAAATALERDDGHILRSALLDIVQASGGKSTRVKGGTALADLWFKHTGEKITGTPGAEEMVILLDKKALEIDDDTMERLCLAVTDFAEKCEDRSVTNKYSAFFETAGKLLSQIRAGR